MFRINYVLLINLVCRLELVFTDALTSTTIRISPNSTKPLQRRNNDYHEGVFGKFLRELLDLLSMGFPDCKAKTFCKMLHQQLEKLDFKITQKLSKSVKAVAKSGEAAMMQEFKSYREELDNLTPPKKEFLTAMDALFTLQQDVLFSDYLNDLKDYGNGYKLDVKRETHNVIKEILKVIGELSGRDQVDLGRKLKAVVKDSEDVVLEDFPYPKSLLVELMKKYRSTTETHLF